MFVYFIPFSLDTLQTGHRRKFSRCMPCPEVTNSRPGYHFNRHVLMWPPLPPVTTPAHHWLHPFYGKPLGGASSSDRKRKMWKMTCRCLPFVVAAACSGCQRFPPFPNYYLPITISFFPGFPAGCCNNLIKLNALSDLHFKFQSI